MSELIPLTKEQARFAERGLGVVESLARVFARQWPTIQRGDFVSVGHEAVVRAAVRFDPDRGVPFEQFARHAIWGSMLDLAHHERFVVQHTTRAIRTAMREARDFEASLDAWLDPSGAPPADEVAGELRQRAAELVALAVAAGGDALTSQENAYVEAEGRRLATARLRAGMQWLTAAERDFVRAYYEEEETLEAIAARLGVSKRTVQRQHDRIKDLLAKALQHDGHG